MASVRDRAPHCTPEGQAAFAKAVSAVIKRERRHQKLTQAELATRTNGLVSKHALANYENGHRSLRIDVVWVIAGALGIDMSDLIDQAEHLVRQAPGQAITISIQALEESTHPSLLRILRWHKLMANPEGLMQSRELTLNPTGLTALASYMRTDETTLVAFLQRNQLLAA